MNTLSTPAKAPRRRINRFAHLLSKEYNVSYEVANHVWNQLGRNVGKAVDVLIQINTQVTAAEAALSTIN